ncbi:MAG: tetratricopeptide (TPR) repeat protein [Chlamydiales bacterium]|jgi:tetratricopeptide (TPR) repeat protein
MDQTPKEEEKVKSLFEDAYQNHVNGKLDDAERTYKKILKLDPNQADTLNNLGCISYLKDNFKQSLKCLLRLKKIHPDFVEGLNNLGKTYDKLDDIPNAINCLKTALDLEPDNEDALVLIGSLLLRSNRAEEAIKCLQYCLKIHPESALVYHNLSVAYEGQKKFEHALQAAIQACEKDPANAAFNVHRLSLILEKEEKKESPEEAP